MCWPRTRTHSLLFLFIGLLFTHWIADSLTLWKPPSKQTDLQLWTSATYYSVLSRMPAPVAYFYMAIVTLGGATLFWSFSDGRAGNLMFDGGSACEFLLSLRSYFGIHTDIQTHSLIRYYSCGILVFCVTKYVLSPVCSLFELVFTPEEQTSSPTLRLYPFLSLLQHRNCRPTPIRLPSLHSHNLSVHPHLIWHLHI